MKNPNPRQPNPRQPNPQHSTPRKRVEWLPYLPAIITALTGLVEVLLNHYHP